jgi:hypothetical protein
MSLPMMTACVTLGRIIRWSGDARHSHCASLTGKFTAILPGISGYPIASFKTGWQIRFKVNLEF